uniref:G-protein coupled receptors family 1 profile domain-containing protein n=1 Tax=Pyxicephalus adspersus TaxID=30357 RepID=A0AAV2ZVK6_PYXAD|nr:TPA: hypothetical protein GDO54_017502 [Pyxicephalus adspersus]
MYPANQSMVLCFFLSGISNDPFLQAPIFFLMLMTYLAILGGNIMIFLLACLDRHLQTPMYFFLCNLSLLDMLCPTVTLHRIFFHFVRGDNTISFWACMSQMFVFASLTCDELLILTAMSYDRYVAICRPLHYQIIMSRRFCCMLTTTCWVIGFVQVLPLVVLLSQCNCFNSNKINHFFCDTVELISLPCTKTSSMELLNFVNGLLLAIFPFFLTFCPYIFIVVTILKIPSSKRRYKTFYTCSSHLTVVILLYTSLVCQYLNPMGNNSSNKHYSLFNTALVPLLNPLIYSLKNKDVNEALRRRCRLVY